VQRPRRFIEVDRRLLRQEVAVRLPVRGNRADVPPVALEAVRASQSLRRLRRKQVAAEIRQPFLADLVLQFLQPIQCLPTVGKAGPNAGEPRRRR
jgi:hypothetical protein